MSGVLLIHPLKGQPCTASIKSTESTNKVVFYKNAFKSPVFILTGDSPNSFYCIYDHDVDWQLIRIRLTTPQHRLNDSPVLSSMILNSDCDIQRVSKKETNAWFFAASQIEKMTDKMFRKESLCRSLSASQADLVASLRNIGDQHEYPEDQ
jgi:hypothetical protein